MDLIKVCTTDGKIAGIEEGRNVGIEVGWIDGTLEGCDVGYTVCRIDGASDGCTLGTSKGWDVGNSECWYVVTIN